MKISKISEKWSLWTELKKTCVFYRFFNEQILPKAPALAPESTIKASTKELFVGRASRKVSGPLLWWIWGGFVVFLWSISMCFLGVLDVFCIAFDPKSQHQCFVNCSSTVAGFARQRHWILYHVVSTTSSAFTANCSWSCHDESTSLITQVSRTRWLWLEAARAWV